MNATAGIRVLAAIALIVTGSGCGSAEGSIGALLGKSHQSGKVLVRSTPEDMSAWKEGLRPGDEILSVDGQDVRYMTAQQIHKALVGPVHTTVRLTVLREGKILRMDIKRGALK